MADPVQARAKDKRRAEALRANLKRRKEQAPGKRLPDVGPRDDAVRDATAATTCDHDQIPTK